MTRALPKKILLFLALTAVMGFLFYTATGYFLQDSIITIKARSLLQNYFKNSGLRVFVAKIYWTGPDRLRGTEIVLRDIHNQSVPFQVKRLELRLNLWAWLKNGFQSETAISEITFINPRLKLNRFADGSWDVVKYFPQSKEKLQMQAVIRIKDGSIAFDDQQFGRYKLTKVSGKINMEAGSILRWQLKGKADLNDRMEWVSRGKCSIDQPAGKGVLEANHLALNRIAPFIPGSDIYRLRSGQADTVINFAWNRSGLWLEKGNATITEAVLFLPRWKEQLILKQMTAEFSPLWLSIKKARIVHNRTVIRLAGEVNTKTTVVKAEISADQISLADLNRWFPRNQEVSLKGTADARVAVMGTIDKPLLDGEVFINNTRLDIEGQPPVERISGRLIIRNNNLTVAKLEGTWNNSLLGMYGKVINLLHPRLDLRVYGAGLNLQPQEIVDLSRFSLKINGKTNFLGAITGELSNPKLSGEVIFEQLSYNNIPIDNFKLTLEWDFPTNSLKILELTGELWQGTLAAKGEVVVNRKGVKWQISGKTSGLNLDKTFLNPEPGVKGRISADLIFKGEWLRGAQFEPGSIYGIFKGERLSYRDASIDELNGVFSWVDGNLSIDSIQAKIGDGAVYGHLSYDATRVLAGIDGENVPVNRLLPNHNQYPLDGIFNGSLSIEGPPEEFIGRIDGTFSKVSWASKSIGTISGVIDYKERGLEISQLQVLTDSGDYLLKGKVDLSSQPLVALSVTSDNIKLSGLKKWLSVSPALALDGYAAINLELNGLAVNPLIHGQISLTNPVFGPIHLEKGNIKIDGDLNDLAFSDCTLTAADSRIAIAGKISGEKFDLNIKGTSINLGRIGLECGGKTVNGVVDLDGRLTGDFSTPVLTANITGRDLSYGAFNYRDLKAKVTWDPRALVVNEAQMKQAESTVTVNGKIMMDPVRLDLGAAVSSLSLKKVLEITGKANSGMEIDGILSGLVTIKGKPANPDLTVTGNLLQGMINGLPVAGEFNLSYSDNRVLLKRVLLTQGTGTLLADGVWENGQFLRVEIGIQDFPCQALEPFLKSPYKIGGVVNSYALLEWSKTGVSGDYRIEINNLQAAQEQLGDLRASGNFLNYGLTVTDGSLYRKGGSLAIKGFLPWPPKLFNWFNLSTEDLKNSPDFSLDFQAQNLPAVWFSLLFPAVSVTDGSVNGSLSFRRAVNKPEIFGSLECNNVKGSIAGFPSLIDNFQATVDFNGGTASIIRMKGGYGKGKFNITGNVDFEGYRLQGLALNLSGSRLYYKNYFFDGYGDVNLALNGKLPKPSLTGEIAIYNSKISIGGAGQTRKKASFAFQPELDVNIKTKDNVRYRQAGIADLPLGGSIQVQGDLTSPRIQGEARAKTGVVTLYGQVFIVKRGQAVFKYSQGYYPYIDIDSRLKTRKAEVILSIKGQLGDGSELAINLSSQPYLPPSELYALLNWSDLKGDKPMTVDGVVTGNLGFVTDSIFGDVFSEVSNALYLDYIYLEPNYQQNDVRINLGDYLTKDLFLTYSRSVLKEAKDIWGLDYQLTPRLSLGGKYSVLDGTDWRLIYRFGF